MVDTDDNTQEFVINQYEKAIENHGGIDEEVAEKIKEKIYLQLKSSDTTWQDIHQLAEEHEQKHEIVLAEVKEFVDKLDDKDFVKSKQDDILETDLTQGKKQALMTQISAQPGRENLIYTDEPISNPDRAMLTMDIWNQQKKAAFIISAQHEWEGRISLELSRTKERYNLTSIFVNADGEHSFQHFGDSKNNKGKTKKYEHTHSFYEYKYITDDDKELRLLSDEPLEPMRCRVKGTVVDIMDYKNVGENAKIMGGEEIVFVHSVEPAIEPMNEKQLNAYRENVDHDFLAEKLFGEFRHPQWYEEMMQAVMFVKDDNGYPSHLMVMAEAGTGKSVQLESLTKSMDEGRPPFTGSSSTIKGLVPSFSESPPDEGFLMRCDRIAAVDEKFNLLANTVQNGNTRMQDAFRPMLDLLEHSSREFSSGNGSITGKTEATMIAMGNPAYGLKSIYDAIEKDKIDEAYLSRFLMYDQLESHIEYINERKSLVSGGADQTSMPEVDDEFVSLIDTMRMKHVTDFDRERIKNIHEELAEMVPNVFLTTFKARYQHHLINLLAGITKSRYITENRDNLIPENEDYMKAKEIMEILISSWDEGVDKTKMSYSARINSLRGDAREVYQIINDQPGITGKELFNRAEEFSDSLSWIRKDLRELELIEVIESDGDTLYHPYWTSEAETVRSERRELEKE